MGIKLIKKESAEPKGHWVVYLRGEEWCTRNTEKEAQAVVNSYDGEGDCWYEFVADEAKSEAAVLNRITMHDARKKCAALQKSGKLSNCLHEVTAAIALVQNALANSSPEIKDNALNSTEKKIVARAVLAEIVSNFNYQPEDLR